MKKLLLVLLVVALASFLFVGCLPVTPAEGEGEGEGEGECETTVEIDGAVVVDGKTYVSGGNHTITVTFCAPVVGGVSAYITDCSGDYSKANGNGCGHEVVLFPNADRTIWTGSGEFGPCGGGCCASYLEVWAGECEDEACIWFPVIVDSCYPFAQIAISVEDCECAGCKITFESVTNTDDCLPDEECCGDDCSGLASWSFVFYDDYPFDECCDPSICEEPIGSCSGTECSISCVTECLSAGEYYAVGTMVDAVGNEIVGYARIVISGDGSTEDCDIDVWAGWPGEEECVEWDEGTTDIIGECIEYCGELS